MLFRPNTTCLLHSRQGAYDIYGKHSFAPAQTIPCAVISYDVSRLKSSVRVDSSGSRGRADELAGRARFLFPRTTTIVRGDVVFKDGYWLKVIEIHPRYAVDGRYDHIEVDFEKTEPVSGT